MSTINIIIDVIIALVIILAILLAICKFFTLTKEQQVERVKHWLLWAVSEAEKELGSGTGQLKLAEVYNSFVNKFPIISNFVTYATFTNWVDQALEDMRHLISSNESVAALLTNAASIVSK